LQPDGTRQEGSDFNDYLGISASYGGVIDSPEQDQFGSLDCSGFVRMVFGYRAGLPLVLDPDGLGLPRRSFQMLASAPGVAVLPNVGTRPTSLSRLLPGDLLFFDASTGDGAQIDHVGIYLGTDSAGAPRFLSSRKTVDGPTMGDVGGRSTLFGTGLYATAFRAARRV
jgi:cell wall-associated NlpC family hydrolase